jgi:pimeloyl-ACP methyl ester carboxylesterase
MTIVTLIHGTWARGARWTEDTSPLAISLKERIHGEVQIEPFEWSGRNLHFSRRRGAAKLRAHIVSVGTKFPQDRHFLIAHSHGGTVALYALVEPELLSLVSGVICLATPFIVSRPRQYPEGTFGSFAFLFVCLAFTLPLAIDVNRSPATIPIIATTIGALTVLNVLGIRSLLSYCVLRHSRGTSDDIHDAITKSFALAKLSSTQLLVLRAPGDEASAVLATSAFASWIVGKLSHSIRALYTVGAWLSGFTDDGLIFVGRVTVMLGTTVALALLVTLSSVVEGRMGYLLVSVLAMALYLMPGPVKKGRVLFRLYGFGLQTLHLAFVLPLLVLCFVFSIPFGIDAALVANLMQFSSEITPVGTFSVVSLKASTAKGLWHSLPYNDSEAFEGIVRWINDHEEK